MPLTHFSAELEDYYNSLEDRAVAFARFRRRERNVLEVCRTIGGIEGDGLMSFWDTCGIDQARVIEAFDEIGCDELADPFQKTKWVRRVIKRDILGPDGNYALTAGQKQEFNKLQHEFMGRFQDAADMAHTTFESMR